MKKIYWVFLFDALVVVAHIFLRDKLGFFDLNKEGNLASLYSGMKLWGLGTVAGLHAYILYKISRPIYWRDRFEPWAWGLLALGVIYIGLDDMMVIHERLGFVLNNIFKTGGFYGESFNWIFYFTPFIILAIALFIFLLIRLWRVNKISASWFFAGLVMWVGSLGTELIGRSLILSPVVNVPLYHLMTIFEESLEMFGATALLVGLVYITAYRLKRHVRLVV